MMPAYSIVSRSAPDFLQAFCTAEEAFALLSGLNYQPLADVVVLVGDSSRTNPPNARTDSQDLPAAWQQHLQAHLDPVQRAAKTQAYLNLQAHQSFFSNSFPAAIQLQRNPYGKPFWQVSGTAFDGGFSLSDTGPFWALAIGPSPLGIDIEKERALPDWQDLAKACFAAEEQAAIQDWQAMDPPPAFFQLWTQKEALLKARGREMPDDLSQWSTLSGRHPVVGETQLGDLAGAALQLLSTSSLPGLHLALTLPHPVQKVFFFTNLHP